MEELLASIRKAIQDDIGESSAAAPPRKAAPPPHPPVPPPVSGSMRELRVRMSGEVRSTSAEISGLRDRIQRNRAAEALARDISENMAPQRPAAPAERSTGPFSAALAGSSDSSWLRPAPGEPQLEAPPRNAPLLRPSYAELETPAAAPEPYRPLAAYGRFGREVEALQQQPPAWREPPPALPPPVAEHPRAAAEEPILSEDASSAATSAFNRLADSFLSRALGERPIEDMARDMLRGLLKQWLDDNLPALVERLVREEIERVARRGR